MALLAPMPSASVNTVTAVNTGDFTSARNRVAQVERQRAHVALSSKRDGVAALARALIVGVRHRDGAAQDPPARTSRRRGGRGRRAVRAKSRFEIGAEALAEFARIGAQQEPQQLDREAIASRHASSGTRRLGRGPSAASRASRSASCASARRPAGCSVNRRRRSSVRAGQFLDETGFFHALQRAVDRAGAHRRLRDGGHFDRLHDAVAVQGPVSQREQDVKNRRRERDGCFFHDASGVQRANGLEPAAATITVTETLYYRYGNTRQLARSAMWLLPPEGGSHESGTVSSFRLKAEATSWGGSHELGPKPRAGPLKVV